MNCGAIYLKAYSVGQNAGKESRPTPVVFYEADLLDRPIGKSYYEAEGVCGFAGVEVRPASYAGKKDCEFVRYCRSNKIGYYSDYNKCWYIPCHEYGQSMQRKEAFAEAFAQVLKENGIQANATSRME